MSVTVTTDAELDRLISVRMSRLVPLQKIISFGLSEHVNDFNLYRLYGVDEHPFTKRMSVISELSAMTSLMHSATHTEKVAHYVASLQQKDSDLVDLRKITTKSGVIVQSNPHNEYARHPLDNKGIFDSADAEYEKGTTFSANNPENQPEKHLSPPSAQLGGEDALSPVGEPTARVGDEPSIQKSEATHVKHGNGDV